MAAVRHVSIAAAVPIPHFSEAFVMSRAPALEARALHLFRAMSRRAHLWIRLGALALLGACALLPVQRAARPRTATAARAETTSARLVSSPRTTKLVVAQATESRTND